MDSQPEKCGNLIKKEVKFKDDMKVANELSIPKRRSANRPTTTAVTVIIPSHELASSLGVQTFVTTDSETGFTTVTVSTQQDLHPSIPSRPRISSLSRSKTPPLPSALKPCWSGDRSRSQTVSQRQVSGSVLSDGKPKSMSHTRRMRVSSVTLTDGMKALTLNELEDMDYTWEN